MSDVAAPTSGDHQQQQQQQSGGMMATSSALHNNNTITICQSYGSNGVEMRNDLGHYTGDCSNTSDFLSSTFSLLTSDSMAAESAHAGWAAYSDDQPPEKRAFYANEAPSAYYTPEQNYGAPPSYPHMPHEGEMVGHHQTIPQPPSRSASETAEPAEKKMKKNSGGSGVNPSAQTTRNSQMEYTENFKRFINIPASTPQRSASSADSGVQSPESDENDGFSQPISCPACKNVYSSPRSLTGHIGRTEKCRELIGRDFIDDIAKMGKPSSIPDSTITGDGISPVCPHCNRFISHYKANVRRHINACKKACARKDSTASAIEAVGSGGSNASMASYDVTPTPDDQPCSSGGMKKEHQTEYHPAAAHHSMPPMHAVQFAHYPQEEHSLQMHPQHGMHGHLPPPQMTIVTSLPPHHPHHLQGHPHMHPAYSAMEYAPVYEPMHHVLPPMPNNYEITYVTTPTVDNVQQPPIQAVAEAPKMPKPPKHNGMVSADDPYCCQWCPFSTVYKGNMKRHLISCHNCTDALLRAHNFELEKLRKTAPNAVGPESLPFIEIKPLQPPGARRPRNPPSAKSLGRPKKSNSTGGQDPSADPHCLTQQPLSAPPIPTGALQHSQEYMLDGQMHQYNLLPPPPSQQQMPQMMVDYGTPMHFVPAHLGHPSTASYIIKDCGNDSGLDMSVQEFAEVAALHQTQALPGY